MWPAIACLGSTMRDDQTLIVVELKGICDSFRGECHGSLVNNLDEGSLYRENVFESMCLVGHGKS